jgi:hypothetical protein
MTEQTLGSYSANHSARSPPSNELDFRFALARVREYSEQVALLWLGGVVPGAEKQGLNHQVVSFTSPADTLSMPGMLRKSTAFVLRYQ